jgi:hypothetical protein
MVEQWATWVGAPTIFAPRVCFSVSALPKSPSQFEGFLEDIAALSPPQQQEIPRQLEIASKYGLEILPPRGA